MLTNGSKLIKKNGRVELHFRLIFATLSAMLKSFKYRIFPTRKQKSLLENTLSICCELYNAALEERRSAYKLAGLSISYTQQQNQLPDIKKSRTDLARVHSQTL